MTNNEDLVDAIRSISHGGSGGPLGIEALVMALVGPASHGEDMPPWNGGNISDRIGQLAEAIEGAGNSIEAGLRALAEAVENSKE